MSHTWLYNPQTEAHWLAPDALVEQLVAGGWETTDAPAEPDAAVAEQAAWREEQAAAAAAERKAAKQTDTAKEAESAKPTRARRSASSEE